jgi:Na+/H+ antiporter NhaA
LNSSFVFSARTHYSQTGRHASRDHTRCALAYRGETGEYSWRRLTGAGALAGIGFSMSLYIADKAFPAAADFAAAKV